jgi:hypothetical protein
MLTTFFTSLQTEHEFQHLLNWMWVLLFMR